MDSTLALPRYEPPALRWPGDIAQRQQIVWWVVFVGFAYGVAIAYAAYCTYRGGHPEIDLTWKGFKITCRG